MQKRDTMWRRTAADSGVSSQNLHAIVTSVLSLVPFHQTSAPLVGPQQSTAVPLRTGPLWSNSLHLLVDMVYLPMDTKEVGQIDLFIPHSCCLDQTFVIDSKD